MPTKFTWTTLDGLTRSGGPRSPETTNATTAMEDEISQGAKPFVVSANYTVSGNDVESIINCSAAVTITIPSDAVGKFIDGAAIGFYQATAGAITITGSGATIRGTAPTAAQYLTFGLIRVAANEWAYL